MEHIELWKLGADICLMAALLYLCYRMIKTPTSPIYSKKADELKAALANLVQEADAASKELNNKLVRRQQTLEKLLFDLGTVEHRLGRATESAEEGRAALDISVSSAKVLIGDLEILKSSQQSTAPRAASSEPRVVRRETPQHSSPPTPTILREVYEDDLEDIAPQKTRGVNIYGEPIEKELKRETTPMVPSRHYNVAGSLSSSIEKEIIPPKPTRQPQPESSMKALAKIYESAEEMIRSGEDVKKIAVQLRLPVEQVRLLSELVAQEDEERAKQGVTTNDPRLGGLAKPHSPGVAQRPEIRRQVEVL